MAEKRSGPSWVFGRFCDGAAAWSAPRSRDRSGGRRVGTPGSATSPRCGPPLRGHNAWAFR